MTTKLAPEPTTIHLHLEVLFSELMPGGAFEDGLFELRFLHPEGGKPFCRLFQGQELDAAIELAISKNSARWNAFAGPNPRQPGTTGAERAVNVARSDWQFVDCDDAKSSAWLRELPFPPNFIVTTGTEPSEREQIDACLNSCERDHSICMESAGAQRSSGTSFGAAQECDRGLSACFRLCRDLGQQPSRF